MSTGDELVYTVHVHDEGDGSLWASVEELPGVFATGDDEAELQASLEESIGLYLSTESSRITVHRVGTGGHREQQQRFLVSA